jgi:carbon dioxide concentrating mechanism protein CcmN
LLQAEPGSRLLIAANVCIGAGAVLHAWDGDLTIESEAVIGAGALVAGHGNVGQRACIGTKATLWNCDIAPGEAIAPNCFITSGLPDEPSPVLADAEKSVASPPPFDSVPPVSPSLNGKFPGSSENSIEALPVEAPSASPQPVQSESTKTPESQFAEDQPSESPPLKNQPSAEAMRQVYGKAYFERMMLSLFPHRGKSQQNGIGEE